MNSTEDNAPPAENRRFWIWMSFLPALLFILTGWLPWLLSDEKLSSTNGLWLVYVWPLVTLGWTILCAVNLAQERTDWSNGKRFVIVFLLLLGLLMLNAALFTGLMLADCSRSPAPRHY